MAPLQPRDIEQAILDAENGEPARIRGILANAPTWHTPGHNLLSGDHMGREQAVHFLEDSRTFTANSLMIEELSPLKVNGDTGTMRIRARAKHGTRSLDAEAEIRVRIEGGLVSEMWTLPRDAEAWDRFWAP